MPFTRNGPAAVRCASRPARAASSVALASARVDSLEAAPGSQCLAEASRVVTENSTHASMRAARAGSVEAGYSEAAAEPFEATATRGRRMVLGSFGERGFGRDRG